jgi:hypothetical protein
MALNESDKKKRFAGGTNRVQTADLGSQPLTRVGASGDGKNLTTNRRVQTGGAGDGFGVDIAGGTGVPGAGRKRVGAFLSRDRIAQSDPTDIAGQIQTISKAKKGITIAGAKGPQRAGFAKGFSLDKPIRHDIIDDRPASIKEIGGTSRGKVVESSGVDKGTAKLTVTKGKRLTAARRKEIAAGAGSEISEQQRKKLGIGEFTKGKGASVFSERGINELFGSAADLAKLFTSKEFQSRKAKGIQQAAGAKGRRVDAKAKTERIKALSGVLEDLSASGGDNEGLMASIQEQIQNLISGNNGDGMSGEVLGKLASQFEPDQVKTILGIMQ